MKRFNLLILLVILLCSAPFVGTGCGSTPQATATHVAGAQVLTVDAAMQAWAEWVNAGYATQAQVDAVRDAYMTYYIAAQAEKKTLLASVQGTDPNAPKDAWQTAASAARAAQNDLIALIIKLKGK